MEHHTWAFGGMGMTKYYGGAGLRSMPLLQTNIGYKMAGVLANDDSDYAWVVVQVCVNDYDVDTGTFNAAYSTFIDTVKARWPNAQVYCIGPMPITMFLTQAAQVQSVASAKGATWIDPTGWVAVINGHLHPLAAEHTAIANLITSEFTTPPIKAENFISVSWLSNGSGAVLPVSDAISVYSLNAAVSIYDVLGNNVAVYTP